MWFECLLQWSTHLNLTLAYFHYKGVMLRVLLIQLLQERFEVVILIELLSFQKLVQSC